MESFSYWRVSPRFWCNSQASWGDDERLVALYLLTSPHRTLEGLFRLPIAYACADMSWNEKRFRNAFATLCETLFCAYDEQSQLCLILKALKYQAPDNPNQIKHMLKQLAQLPDCPRLFALFYQQAKKYCERVADALPERFRNAFETVDATVDETVQASVSKPTATATAIATATEQTMSSLSLDRVSSNGNGNGKTRSLTSEANDIFVDWQDVMGHSDAKFTAERKARVLDRLRDGYSVDYIKEAIRGCKSIPHNSGQNDRNKRYDDLELICRNATKLEYFHSAYVEKQSSAPRVSRSDQLTVIRQRLSQGFDETDLLGMNFPKELIAEVMRQGDDN